MVSELEQNWDVIVQQAALIARGILEMDRKHYYTDEKNVRIGIGLLKKDYGLMEA